MSSANFTKSPGKETGTPISTTKSASYAQVTRPRTPIRESLQPKVHANATHSNVWKQGGSPASCPSLFFDLTSRPESRSALLCHINASYPENCGARLHSDHSRRIVELFIADPKLYEKIYTTGLIFSDGSCIIPTKPLPENSSLLHIHLTNLPFNTRESLANGIRQALSPFGELQDYGILRDHDSHLFMGHGYATLNVSASKDYFSLSHTIPWPNSDDYFHATWADMPLHCLHCHQPGHSLSTCPKHPSRTRLCWSCGQIGHRAAKCPNHSPSAVQPNTNEAPMPPSSPSPSNSTALSQSSDITMDSIDYSPLEAHNDEILSQFIPDKPNPRSKKPEPHLLQSIYERYPFSDEAKTIIASLPSRSFTALFFTLRKQGRIFPNLTPSVLSSESISSTSPSDPD